MPPREVRWRPDTPRSREPERLGELVGQRLGVDRGQVAAVAVGQHVPDDRGAGAVPADPQARVDDRGAGLLGGGLGDVGVVDRGGQGLEQAVAEVVAALGEALVGELLGLGAGTSTSSTSPRTASTGPRR